MAKRSKAPKTFPLTPAGMRAAFDNAAVELAATDASTQADASGPTEATVTFIKYEVARDECKAIRERAERDHWRLGEIAHKVETRYDERTLAKLSKDSGFADCTLERHRSVYRAWMEKPALGPVLYSVLRALQDHPDRYNIVTENPKLTQAKAREIMQAWRAENPSTATATEEADQDDDLLDEAEPGPTPTGADAEQPEDIIEPEGKTEPTPTATASTPARAKGAKKTESEEQAKLKEDKQWFNDVVDLANQAIAEAEVMKCPPEQARQLAQTIEPRLVQEIEKGGEALLALADWFNTLLAEASEEATKEGRIKTSPKRASAPSQMTT
jgi:hypothetical protein